MARRLRLDELSLLVLPWSVCLAGLALLAVTRYSAAGVSDIWPGLAMVGVFLIGHVFLVWKYRDADQVVLPITAALSGIGLIFVGRLAPSMLDRQTTWLGIGLVAMLAVLAPAGVLDWLRRYRYTWAILGIGLLGVTLVLGVDPNQSGARLWLGYGDYLFQPVELLKLLLVAFLAAYFDEKRELLALGGLRIAGVRLLPLPYLAPSAVMLAITLLLLLVQRDLGPAFLFFGVFLAMLYIATTRSIYVLTGLLFFIGAAYLAYNLVGVAQLRVDIWLDPWSDPHGQSYQIVQALVAFASGGVLGTGLGYGAPTLIPAVHTDFPFAAIAEELGLLGGLAIICLYAILATRAFRIALDRRDGFGALLAAGLGTILGLQSLIILAGNLKLVPLTGITLPFISYGGSSLVTNFILIGLLLRLSQRQD